MHSFLCNKIDNNRSKKREANNLSLNSILYITQTIRTKYIPHKQF
jgi:hypothetical protein